MILLLRQLQEKCRDQSTCKPLFLAVVDPTKPFDLVSRKVFFSYLKNVMFAYSTQDYQVMKGTVSYDEKSSEPFKIDSGVKQGDVLAPTLFATLFLAQHAHSCIW